MENSDFGVPKPFFWVSGTSPKVFVPHRHQALFVVPQLPFGAFRGVKNQLKALIFNGKQ